MINKLKQWLHRDCASQIQSWKDKYHKIDMELVIIKGEREYTAKQLNETKQIIKHMEGKLHRKTQVSSSKAVKLTTLHEDHPLAGNKPTVEDIYAAIHESGKKTQRKKPAKKR